jgi:hypothetical protein
MVVVMTELEACNEAIIALWDAMSRDCQEAAVARGFGQASLDQARGFVRDELLNRVDDLFHVSPVVAGGTSSLSIRLTVVPETYLAAAQAAQDRMFAALGHGQTA